MRTDEIRARLDAATPGEWKVVDQGNTVPSLQVVNETTWEHPKQIKVCSSISPKREADAYFIANAPTDLAYLLDELADAQARARICEADAKTWREDRDKLYAENAVLRKALEIAAHYIVVFGLCDERLCDDIPQEIHLKHQPANDGNYENGPCMECVQEYYIQQARKAIENDKQV